MSLRVYKFAAHCRKPKPKRERFDMNYTITFSAVYICFTANPIAETIEIDVDNAIFAAVDVDADNELVGIEVIFS